MIFLPLAPFANPFDGVIVFAVSLLIGAAAIHVASTYAVHRDEPRRLGFEHALLTALLGAVV